MTTDRGSLTRLAPLVLGAVVVALVAGGATGALPLGDAGPDGEAVLDRAEARYESADSIVGNATVTVANDTVERTRTVSFAAADPNMTRVATTHNGSRYVVGTNGTVAWAYDAANDTVRVRDLDANRSATGNRSDWSYANVSRAVDENTTARLLRTGTVDGQAAYVVAVEPANESREGNTTLWVDTDDYRVHRLTAARGDNRTTVAFSSVQFNVSVHESTFRPPGGADVTVVSRETFDAFDAAQSATDLDLRRLDAEGYAFSEAVVATRAGRTVALQRYGGPANVTLAATAGDLPDAAFGGNRTNATTATVTVAGANATYVERSDRAAVVWTGDGVTRAVVADLDRETLVALAERVRS